MNKDSIKHVTIVGTGMIGASQAALFTGNGYRTSMLALDQKHADAGKKRYEDCFKDLVAKGLVTERQREICAGLFSIAQSYEEIGDTDFVYESISENLEAKHRVYKQVEEQCPRVKVIASATSAISTDELAQGVTRKDRIVTAHPCNPPHLVPLVEIVPGNDTGTETVATTRALLEAVGRKVVVMKRSVPGFIVNRLQHALFREATFMVEQGYADPRDIDEALKYSVIPRYTSIGPFEHIDNSGVDLNVSVEDYLFPHLSKADKASPFLRELRDAGKLGVKTGQGVYDWSGADLDAFRLRTAKPYFGFFNWNLPQE